MFKLRQTWSDVFPPKKLYALDVRVKSIDPAWPVTAPLPTSIHLNPAFLPKVCILKLLLVVCVFKSVLR